MNDKGNVSTIRSVPDLAIFGGSSHPELAATVAKAAGIKLGQMDVITFKNNQRLVKFGESVRGSHTYLIQTTTDTDPDRDIFELFQMVDAARRASAASVSAVLPAFPYARSEKKDQPRIPITGSMIAGMLERYCRCARVITMDLHTPAIQGFFHTIPCDELWAAPLFAAVLGELPREKIITVATDTGADKNLGGRYRKAFCTPTAAILKERVGNTEKTVSVGIAGNVEGAYCILFDDEIATGGTLAGDAKFLLDRGARGVLACVTHAVLVGEAPELIAASPLDTLYVTDTIPVPEEKIRRADGKIRVISCARLLGQAILRTHRNESLQPMLNTEFVRGLIR